MNFHINITSSAYSDIADALVYIKDDLNMPRAAKKLLSRIEEEIEFLKSSADSLKIIDDPVLKSHNIRYTVIDNYMLFYTINRDEVFVLRLLHSRRDWLNILKSEL